jgi:hypothetical protein
MINIVVTDDPGLSPDQKYAPIRYRQFITIRYKFKVSTYFLELMVTDGWNRKIEMGKRLATVMEGGQCSWKVS